MFIIKLISNLEVVINEDNTRSALLKVIPGAYAVYLASKIIIDEEIIKTAGKYFNYSL